MNVGMSLPPGDGATKGQRVALLVGVAVVFWLVLELFASVLLPFVAAAGVAYFLDPLASRLERAGVRRALGAGLLIFALLALGLLFALLLYPLIIAQLGILISRVPSYILMVRDLSNDAIASLQERLGPEFFDDRVRELVSSQAGAMLSFLTSALRQLVGGGFALFNVLTLMVVTPIVAFYLLRDWPGVVARIDGWLPRRYEAVLRAQAREVDRILSAWLRGQALCCVVLALYYAMALSAVGLDLGLIVGLSSGLLSFIPYVGTVTGCITSLALASAQFQSWTGVGLVAGVFVLGQALEGYVIYPRFLGDRVELHAVWVIFALFAGGAAFGFVGVLLAVPVAATIGVLCRFWLRRYLASPLYLDQPAPPVIQPAAQPVIESRTEG
jgi:predicted PurR-regulated permease PerM